ncbi:MAG TPA: type I-U CRISPR-associated protein Csb2 [Verrucomicrobiae bacterium]
MLTLALHFLWGRYYAHPWGVNPARLREAEWPPSPWRLLRTIAAAWFQGHPEQQASPELLELLNALGSELPDIELPKVAFSKTVHYQPNYGATAAEDQKRAEYKRVRHENHFAAVSGPVLFHYDLLAVPEAQREKRRDHLCMILQGILSNVSYFGRAESVCELNVLCDAPVRDAKEIASVVRDEQGCPCRRIAEDCRDVFCPTPDDFRAEDLWQRRNAQPTANVALPHLVQDLLDASQPLPDGARWFSYRMPEGWPKRWVVRHPAPSRPKPRSTGGPTVASFLRFSLQCRIGIARKFVVSLAEQFRAQAMKRHGDDSFALSGHARPPELQGDHQHAFYLPRPTENPGFLEELWVWCAHGFTQQEVEALMKVGALRWADGRYPARPVLLEVQRSLPRVEPTKLWKSFTPFVPPRFWYRKKIVERDLKEGDSPELQLGRCLRDAGVQTPGTIRRIDTGREWDVCKVHLPDHSNGREPDQRIGVFLEVEFEKSEVLPFPALGHSCHFGLGLFVPAE